MSYILDMLLYCNLCPTYFGANNMYFYTFGSLYYICRDKGRRGHGAQKGTILFFLFT